MLLQITHPDVILMLLLRRMNHYIIPIFPHLSKIIDRKGDLDEVKCVNEMCNV